MPTENNPAVIYLGPACEAETGDGRTWAEDWPWPDCECGHQPVQYVLGETFNRVKAEREALQADLDAKDQRVDELEQQLRALLAAPAAQPKGEPVAPFYICVEDFNRLVRDDTAIASVRINREKRGAFTEPLYTSPPAPVAVADDDWHMNPCKQGHRDVGAAGGVASCYQCGEKITAATTQEAFKLWNAAHP